MFIFLIAFFVVFTIISFYNLRWAIFLVLAALPSYLIRFQVLGIPMTALEGMILIIFLIWVLNRFKIKDLRLKIDFLKRYKLFFIFYFLFFISATAGMFVSPNLREAAGIWKAYFIEPVLFFIVLISELRGVKDFKFVISALSVSALYISIYAILQRFFGVPPHQLVNWWGGVPIPAPWQSELRVTSVFPYPNAVGLFLAPLIPLFIYQLILRFKIKDLRFRIFGILYWLVATVLSLAAIYFAKTEAALVALAAGSIFVLLFYNKKTRLTLVFLFLCFFVFLFLFGDSFSAIKDKLLLEDWSGKVRITMWSETWQMLEDKPIFGAGLSGYQTAISPYHKAGWMEVFLYPHNIIFNFWSETGLLGLFSFFGIVLTFFYLGFKNLFRDSGFGIGNYKIGYFAILASMVIILVHGLVDVPYFKNDLAVLFWAIVALPIIIKNDKMD